MKYILILILITTLSACGGSRKPKVFEKMIICKITPYNGMFPNSYQGNKNIFSKYVASSPDFRPYRFIDTSGKFAIGDIVYPEFHK